MAIKARIYRNERTNRETYSRQVALQWYRENDDTIAIIENNRTIMKWNSMGMPWQAMQRKIEVNGR